MSSRDPSCLALGQRNLRVSLFFVSLGSLQVRQMTFKGSNVGALCSRGRGRGRWLAWPTCSLQGASPSKDGVPKFSKDSRPLEGVLGHYLVWWCSAVICTFAHSRRPLQGAFRPRCVMPACEAAEVGVGGLRCLSSGPPGLAALTGASLRRTYVFTRPPQLAPFVVGRKGKV